jgi:ribonuclease HII
MRPDSVNAVCAALGQAEFEGLAALIDRYSADERSGVCTAVAAARRRLDASRRESERLETLYSLEDTLRGDGHVLVCGVDEVGRGALAGPLTAGACILPGSPRIPGLNDSKPLSPAQRADLAARIRQVAVAVSVAHVSAAEVDGLGVTAALRRAMRLSVEGLRAAPDKVVIDGLPLHLGLDETNVVKGDSVVAAIAAASVVAKVERDALMVELAADFPQFEFERNKGYGAPEHIEAIRSNGLCSIHRRSFCRNFTDPTLF